MAPRPRRRDRADLGGGRMNRAELHPKLAGEAASCKSARCTWRDRPGRARHSACRPVRLGVTSGFPHGRGAPSAWRGAKLLAPAALARRSDARAPLLFILHLGYAWLALGSALLGMTTLGLDVPQSAAIHALTAGAIGTMTLAVMTRATRGHTGRVLSADGDTVVIYLLVNIAAIIRVAAAASEAWTMPLLVASAILWIGAFALFVLVYAPMLLLPERA